MSDSVMEQAEYMHAVRIWKIIPPFLIILGTLGNFLTIIVLTRPKSRNSSTAIYLTALACSDLLVLYTGLLRQWIKHVFDMDVRELSETGCKLHVFLVYLGTQLSSWLLVAVTSERFIGVWCPHRVKTGCTTKTALIVIVLIVVSLALLNVHWLYGMGTYRVVIENVTFTLDCYSVYDEHYDFLSFTWPWIDLCVFCLVPFSVLLVGNISIILKVIYSKHKTRKQIAPQQSAVAKKMKKDNKTSQLTLMLMTINIVFFVCALPISIYLIGEPHWLETIDTAHEHAVLILWWAVVNIFMYTNHTINFIMYFLSGSRFRQEVKALFCGGRTNAIFGVGTATTRIVPEASVRTIQTDYNVTEA